MVKYLIGDIAGFDTDTFSLVSRHDATQVVALGATAGRCLLVLLEANGEIVTKRTLLAQGWEQYGAVVSDNNLSQSIVRIRRALQQLEVDPAALVTVPRIGYRLTGVTRVTPFVDALTGMPSRDTVPSDGEKQKENSQDSLPSNDHSLPAFHAAIDSGDGVATPSRNLPDEVCAAPASGQPAQAEREVAARAPVVVEHRKGYRIGVACTVWLGVAAVSTALAAWAVPALRGDLRTNAPQAQWQAVDAGPAHRIFVSTSFHADGDFVRGRLSRLSQTPPVSIADAAERYVYINGATSPEVFSYFLCRGPILGPTPDCLSYVFIAPVAS
ncbi:transcriptional regulator [Pandoraea sp. NPDC087047]|uniref:winged helix-turn-helix domain-containing protein n=1 Tax=Pandoraea sp. NPDC087047 TaxID=3364390 RepID=UPI003829247E